MVVPMLAPMITPTAWWSCMSPAFTSPTTMTVVMVEDWTRTVTPVPVAVAMNRLSVTRLIIRRREFPATACIPSDMYFIPSMKMPRPPTTAMAMVSTLPRVSFTSRISWDVGSSRRLESLWVDDRRKADEAGP
jgi:hypothetical protein